MRLNVPILIFQPLPIIILAELLDLVLKLAEGIDFVRVDLYNVKGKIYFGEMTFTPGAGRFQFSPEVWDQRLGEWWRDSK